MSRTYPNDTEGIAAWFIDTDYDEENFFVRHAYFLGAQDPYKSLKTALKAETGKAPSGIQVLAAPLDLNEMIRPRTSAAGKKP